MTLVTNMMRQYEKKSTTDSQVDSLKPSFVKPFDP
jgi:hypothetical protein